MTYGHVRPRAQAEALRAFAAGCELDDGVTAPAKYLRFVMAGRERSLEPIDGWVTLSAGTYWALRGERWIERAGRDPSSWRLSELGRYALANHDEGVRIVRDMRERGQ